MSATATLVTGVSGRYATALFELATEGGFVASVESDLIALDAALTESADLRTLTSSPLYSREEQASAMAAVGKAMGLGHITANTLGLMASKRRLHELPKVIRGYRALAAAARGAVTAEVTAATALSPAQLDSLRAALKAAAGKDVTVTTSVDPALIGGLMVRLGSKMIDTSIRSKLAKLQNVMKEVG